MPAATSKPGQRDIALDYTPQPKQAALHACPANEILYGGAAGPGKSHAIRHEALIWAQRIPQLQVYLFRRTYPELEKNHILKILSDWGNKYGTYQQQQRRYALPNGSTIHMCHAQHDKDVMLYHGAEIHLLVIDELTTFSEWQYVYLRNRVRSTLDIPQAYQHRIPGCVSGSNPGGPGHEFCKRTFVDFCLIDEDEAAAREADEELGPIYAHPINRTGATVYYGIRKAPNADGGMWRAYIPGLLADNPILLQRDPGYVHRVEAMPEPYRSAYLDGDWDIFLGQMFNFNTKHHVCKPHPVPAQAKIYFSFDWGFGAPFSCGWCYCDADGRLYRFGEWYGWAKMPNKGLRLSDSEIAEGICRKEKELGLRTETGGIIVDRFDCGRPTRRDIEYILSPDCFSKKPDYRGGGQGPSTAETFGEYGLIGYPGDATRDQKIRQFHERLRLRDGDEAPMFQAFNTCTQFIRTIPLLQQDEHNPEDVDSDGEDHCYDEQALVFMARPISMVETSGRTRSYDKRIEALMKGGAPDAAETYYGRAAELAMDSLGQSGWESDDLDEYDDGDLVGTVDGAGGR